MYSMNLFDKKTLTVVIGLIVALIIILSFNFKPLLMVCL